MMQETQYCQRLKSLQGYQWLLQKRKVRAAELYQAAKLSELLPNGPNELWQMDVTNVHIPGLG